MIDRARLAGAEIHWRTTGGPPDGIHQISHVGGSGNPLAVHWRTSRWNPPNQGTLAGAEIHWRSAGGPPDEIHQIRAHWRERKSTGGPLADLQQRTLRSYSTSGLQAESGLVLSGIISFDQQITTGNCRLNLQRCTKATHCNLLTN